MDYTGMIESKKSKIESSLCELYNEITTATKYLHQLKENSAAVVKNLNSISTPSTFLQEFMNVNSFLLKSITFLTEINCKFVMLDLSDKWVKNLSSSANSKIDFTEFGDESRENLNNESLKEVNSNLSKNKAVKKVTPEKSSKVCLSHTVTLTKGKKSKKKKSQQCDKIVDNNCAVITTTNENCKINGVSSCSCNDNDSSLSGNDNDSSHIMEAKQMSNSGEQTKLGIDTKSLPQVVLSAKKCGNKENCSQKSLTSECSPCQNNQEKIQNDSFAVNKNPSDTVLCNTSHVSGDIPVAEVVPTKVWDWWSNSKVPDEIESSQGLESDSLAPGQLKIENEDGLDDIKPIELVRKLGEEHDVLIEHIKSPSEFYVSLIDRYKYLLKEMEQKLEKIPVNKNDAFGRNKKYTKAELSSKIGKYALVYLKCDEIWCRAQITNWCLNYNDNFVNVFLLDYGESKCISTNDLHPMPECFKQYPAFIVRCHLYDVFPLDMDMNKPTISWGRESSEKMKALTENSKQVRIKIAPDDCYHSSASLPVTLWLVDQDNQCVNDLLVKTKYAIHETKLKESEIETNKIKTDKIEPDDMENDFLNKWNPMKEDFESYQNSYDFDIKDPAAIIYGYIGKDYERICKHFAKTGYCFKGESCRKEHQRLDHLGFTTDQEEIYQSAFYNLSLPPVKSIINVQVTCLLSYNTFFCFLETQKSSPEETLQSLLKHMNKKENVLEMKKLLIPPSPGQIVIACYSEDDAWYRAQILESQPENDKYTVVFVDYGNKETKCLSDIRAIEARYLHLPFQAVQCRIFGIDQNPDVPLKEIMDYIRQRMDDGHISIEVIAKLPGEQVTLLVNAFDQKGRNIGEDLISRNYAVPKKEMVINSNSESLPG